jgi:hypothetical protein
MNISIAPAMQQNVVVPIARLDKRAIQGEGRERSHSRHSTGFLSIEGEGRRRTTRPSRPRPGALLPRLTSRRVAGRIRLTARIVRNPDRPRVPPKKHA